MSDEKELTVINVITCFAIIALMVIGFLIAIIGIDFFFLIGGPYILYALSMGYITNHELLFYCWCVVMIPTMLIWLKGMLARERKSLQIKSQEENEDFFRNFMQVK